jgi:competence protein ComEC
LTRRILEAAPGRGGAIVAALVTGKRGAIDDETDAALRDSGLAHLLSISGLHMSMATGLVFFLTRAALALAPPIALRYPIKKWAAGAAILGGFVYLLFSGLAWAAQRAFIMSAIVFVAIIFDRRALSLRNVAVAALIILLTAPESVVHPGFQMSFAAVTALIAWYERSQAHADPRRSFSVEARARRYFLGIAATDTIAAAATAPFSLFHFHRTANFGLPANIVAIPITGFLTMPAAILALLLWPVGWDAPFWRLAAAGADAIIAAARWASDLPGAVSTTPHWSGASLAILSLGGVILCLLTTPLRLAGFIALPIAVAVAALAGPPADLFVSGSGRNVGIVERREGAPAHMIVFDRRRDRFQIEAWAEFSGVDPERPTVRASDVFPCDRLGCVIVAKGERIAISTERRGLLDDCPRADLVIALYPIRDRTGCAAPLIDRADIWRDGAHAIALSEKKIRLRTVGATRRDRPWTPSEG